MPVRTVHLIAAARPNFMKVAPLWHALKASGDYAPVLVHTGQHYDANMSAAFLADLGLPEPDFHLGVGSGSHAEQTGRVMIAYGEVAEAHRPDWLVVVGDVNSTIACALVGTKLGIPTVHLEAGLRSRDRRMPEELNRLATDVLCDVLWTPSPDADRNLLAEGIPAERISRVGNIMLDSFEMSRPAIEAADMPDELGLERGGYAVVTLHRPSNVDDPAQLRRLVEALAAVQAAAADRLPGPSAHRRAAGGRRARPRRWRPAGVRLIEPLALYPLHEPGARRRRGDHRFRRPAGRDHLSRHPLLHPAREYRAADHRSRRAPTCWRRRTALPACSTRRWRAATRRAAPPGILGRQDRRALRRRPQDARWRG